MEVFANGYSYEGNSAFAVIVDDKKYVYKFKDKTINAAEILALIFTLKGNINNQELIYNTNNKYVADMMEKFIDVNGKAVEGRYARTPVNSVDIITEARELVKDNVKINVIKSHKTLDEAKKLARKAVGKD